MPLFFYLIHFRGVVWLVIAGVQDYRTGIVSNWLTIPLFIGGIVAMLFIKDPLLMLFAVMLFLAWFQGWAGGAETKVLIGLLGFWFPAFIASMLVMALYGVFVLIFRRGNRSSFPGLVAMALGAGLTFLYDISIMFLNRGTFP